MLFRGSIQTPEQLIGKTIVSSFTDLAEDYFRRLEAKQSESHGQTNGVAGNKLRTNVKFLSGSVEAACALAVADGIVDLVGMSLITDATQSAALTLVTESGETMRAAGLKAIDTVVDSTAVLISSKHPSDPKLVSVITNRIKGVITAQKYILCTYNVPRSLLEKVRKITPGKRAPTITSLEDEGWVAVQVMEQRTRISTVMDELIELGAEDIIVTEMSNSRTT